MNERSQDEAHHRTVITTPYGPACLARETCEEVMQRLRVAVRSNQGWFEVTDAHDGVLTWINAHMVVSVRWEGPA